MKAAIEAMRSTAFSKSENSREWAASTSDEKMIYALPSSTNKKHYTKLTHETTLDKLE